MGTTGLIIVGMFPVFGAIRLARFNIDEETSVKKYFTGVPITAAGGIIALLTIFNFVVPEAAVSAIYTLLCVLMVSRLKIPSLKDVPIPKYGTIITALLLSLIVVTRYNAAIEYSNWIIFAILAYLVFMLIHFLLKKKRLSEK
jgi:CDP-diacylglycerol---serine O-phosphatidyltransferase